MDSESIANFCAITDASDTTAEYYLSAAGGDLDMAIGLFYESAGSGSGGGDSTRNIHEISAQMSERNTTKFNSAPATFNSAPATNTVQTIVLNDDSDSSDFDTKDRVIMDPSRIEATQSSSQSESEDPIFNSRNNTGTTAVTAKRLADLFRPPHGIMFNGTFEMARRFAREQNRWLLVTVHAPTDFPSQAMNRDLWNSPLLQSFIKENFVFVQMIVGGGDEQRYRSFYPFDDLYPHVALIDPRTGERVETLLVASIPVPGFKLVPNDREMLEILGEFIAGHGIDSIGAQRKRLSPVLNENFSDVSDVEPETKKVAQVSEIAQVTQATQIAEATQVTQVAHADSSILVPEIVPNYEGVDGIQIRFRLPSGQRHSHRFSPHANLAQVFQTAAALSQTPLNEFKLRTAEHELDCDEIQLTSISNLHNSLLTIIK